MDCRTFESKIPAYIAGKLNMEDMQEFLEHMDTCSACYDELEITYSVMQGIRQLDSEDGDASAKDLELPLKDSIYFAQDRVQKWTTRKVIKYALNTAAFWSVAMTLWFQIRFWIEGV